MKVKRALIIYTWAVLIVVGLTLFNLDYLIETGYYKLLWIPGLLLALAGFLLAIRGERGD